MKNLFALGWLCLAACVPADLSSVPKCTGDIQCVDGTVCHEGRCLQPYTSCNRDGILDPGEICDDGDESNNNGCTNTCVAARCGDGIKRQDAAAGMADYEACDDGNASNLDGCTNACVLAVCGDGLLRSDRLEGEPGFEVCDDGNLVNGDGCNDACRTNRCGDGIVWLGHEACDDGNTDATDSCTNTCEIARCGDGIWRRDRLEGEAGYEACDDGEDGAGACLVDCTFATCGDGIVRGDLEPEDEGFEACDDGNSVDDDACLTTCQLARCGDGILRHDLPWGDPNYEVCDDGNDVALDECTTNCGRPGCGDGVLDERNELCDDGNNDPDDGCSPNCGRSIKRIEAGFDHTCALTENGYVYCQGLRASVWADGPWMRHSTLMGWSFSALSGVSTDSRTQLDVAAANELEVTHQWRALSVLPQQGAVTDFCSDLMTSFVRGEGVPAQQGLWMVGDTRFPLRLSPETNWRALRCRTNVGCAIDATTGYVHCWRGPTRNRYGTNPAGPSEYLLTVGPLQLTPPLLSPLSNEPITGARDIAIATGLVCVHLDNGSAVCSSRSTINPQAAATAQLWLGSGPQERFEQIVGLAEHVCGRRLDQTVVCLNGENLAQRTTDFGFQGGAIETMYPGKYADMMGGIWPVFKLRRHIDVGFGLWPVRIHNGGIGSMSSSDGGNVLYDRLGVVDIESDQFSAWDFGRLQGCSVDRLGRGVCFGSVGLSGSQCHALNGSRTRGWLMTPVFARQAVASVHLSPETGSCNNRGDCSTTLDMVVLDRSGRAELMTGVDPAWGALGPVVDVALGLDHQCALRRNGRVLCKGKNDSAELGVPSDHLTRSAEFHLVPGVPAMKKIEVRRGQTCASTEDGQLWCWGRDQLPARMDLPAPVRVWTMNDGFTNSSSCIVMEDNSVLADGARLLAAPSEAPIRDVTANCCTVSGEEGLVHCPSEDGYWLVHTEEPISELLTDFHHRLTRTNRLLRLNRVLASDVVYAAANRETVCVVDGRGQLRCQGRLTALNADRGGCGKSFMTGW